MRNFLATLALLAVLSVSAFAVSLTGYTSPKGDFTIKAPGAVAVENVTGKDTSGQPVSLSCYSTEEPNGNKLIVTTATYQYLVSPDKELKAADGVAASVNGKIYAQGSFQGSTLSFIALPDGSKMALLTKAKGSEFFMVAFYAPEATIATSADEVKDILTSFSTEKVGN